MVRKATDQVTTIGIDIGKSHSHLIRLDGRSGSTSDSRDLPLPRPLPGVNQTKLAR